MELLLHRAAVDDLQMVSRTTYNKTAFAPRSCGCFSYIIKDVGNHTVTTLLSHRTTVEDLGVGL